MIARWPRPLFYVVMVLALVADQLTKAWATMSLKPITLVTPIHSVTLVPGFFSLTYVGNRGIAFGMFQGEGFVIAAFMIVLALVALYYARGLNWALPETNIVGGLLCGGALGNLVDRARLGYVVDFFDVYVGPYDWPVFNVADSLICIAVGWIVLRQVLGAPKKG